jgi:hypothetical protein
MKLLLAILLLCNIGLCQQPCDHTSESDLRFKHTRLLPPVRITLVTPTTIETIHQDKHGTYIGSYVIEKDSVVPKDLSLETTKGKKFWILFCDACRHLYVVAPVP